ncbi:MAG: hypothetical protein U0136_07685 [Bdellovibrionota bacterium]
MNSKLFLALGATVFLTPPLAWSQDLSRFARHGADDVSEHQGGDDSSSHSSHSSSSSSSSASPGSSTSRVKIERKQKNRNGILQRDEFKAQAKLPVPLTEAGITAVADVDSADVEIVLARSGTTYATCRLALDELDDEHGSVRAEFQVSLRTDVKKGVTTTRVQRGSCDTDLNTPGDENTVPDFQKTDTVQLSVNGVIVPAQISLKKK